MKLVLEDEYTFLMECLNLDNFKTISLYYRSWGSFKQVDLENIQEGNQLIQLVNKWLPSKQKVKKHCFTEYIYFFYEAVKTKNAVTIYKIVNWEILPLFAGY